MASTYYYSGEHSKAVELYEKSLAIALEIGDPESAGNSHFGLCMTFMSLGDFERAFSHSEEYAKAFEGKEQARATLNSFANEK